VIDRIQAMRIFARIVETNSFTRAARSLDMPRPTASTLMQQLEAMLGTQLLMRTTRSVSVTPEGAAYYERCSRILAEVDELEANLKQARENPGGRLRVEMPTVVATSLVLPALNQFHARYPDIDLIIGVGQGNVDLVADAVDCSIQFGDLPDSLLAARRLGALEHVTCASPDYLSRKGVPTTLEDLSQHVAVAARPLTVRVNGFVAVNDEHTYLTSGLHGLGLIQPPRIAAQPLIDAGHLCEVLPQWRPVSTPVSVVYVKGRHVSPRLRVFVDWLVELFENARHVERDRSRAQAPTDPRRPASVGMVVPGSPHTAHLGQAIARDASTAR
jgi:LysR family transcriptional regulator for bpeEF and oprC